MKQPYFNMLLLNLGPTSLGNDVNVYLLPLIDQLNELWTNGINAYDAHTIFCVHAALFWTMSDFSAYVMLSGSSPKIWRVRTIRMRLVVSLRTYGSIFIRDVSQQLVICSDA